MRTKLKTNCTSHDLKWSTEGGSPVVGPIPTRCMQLDLSNTRIGDAAAEALARALGQPGAPALKVLKLQRNRIGDSGAAALSFYIAGCEVVHLSSNAIGDEGAQAIATALTRQAQAAANNGPGLTLRALHLANNLIEPEGGVALGRSLRGNPVLEVLVLDYNPIGAEGARALAATVRSPGTNIRDLRLTRTRAGDSGVAALGAALASEHCRLVNLEIGLNGAGDEGAMGVAKGLEEGARFLEALYLTGHPSNLRNDGNPDHSGEPLGDLGAVAIAQAIAERNRNKDPERRSKLRVLDLSRGEMGDAGAEAIGSMLRADAKLEVLKLQENLVGDTGAMALARALSSPPPLEPPPLPLADETPGKEAQVSSKGRALGEWVPRLRALEELHLRFNNVHEEGASALWAALRLNPQMHQLVLYDNMVSGTVMDRVRECLHKAPGPRLAEALEERKQLLAQSPGTGGDGQEAGDVRDDEARRGLEAVYDLLSGCGLGELFETITADLGVECPSDLAHVDRPDLHALAHQSAHQQSATAGESAVTGKRLGPRELTELVECVCESPFRDLATGLCGADEL